MLNVSHAFDHIAHALRYTSAADMDEKLSPRMIVDHAGQFLYSIRSWEFAKRMTGLGSLVANQNTIELPLGVASIIAIQRVSSDPTMPAWPWTITRTTQEDIARFSATWPIGLTDGQTLSLLWAPSFERNEIVPLGLELTATVWPTPTQSATDSLAVTFEAKWESLPDNLDDINEWTLPIPEYAEQFYLAILRETAKGYENDSGGTVEQRLASFRAWPSFDAAVHADNRVAPVNGPLRNTAIEQARCMTTRSRRDYPILVNIAPPVDP